MIAVDELRVADEDDDGNDDENCDDVYHEGEHYINKTQMLREQRNLFP